MAGTEVYLGLGSNVGDRAETLLEAMELLDATEGLSVRTVSTFIETDPVGGPADQPKYLNGAARLDATIPPRELLARCRTVEQALGRRREEETRWGPRTCDLDILLFGQVTMNAPELTIPHPRMHQRLFVLRPLSQIAPSAVHPTLDKTVAQLLAELSERSHPDSGDAT